MRFWSMQGGWVEPLQFRKRELFKQVNGSPLYLANQLSILSLANQDLLQSFISLASVLQL